MADQGKCEAPARHSSPPTPLTSCADYADSPCSTTFATFHGQGRVCGLLLDLVCELVCVTELVILRLDAWQYPTRGGPPPHQASRRCYPLSHKRRYLVTNTTR